MASRPFVVSRMTLHSIILSPFLRDTLDDARVRYGVQIGYFLNLLGIEAISGLATVNIRTSANNGNSQ